MYEHTFESAPATTRPEPTTEATTGRRSPRAILRQLGSFAAACSIVAAPAVIAGVLHEATKSGDLRQVQKLVVQGEDVNKSSEAGETPLIVAALTGQGEIANYLLQRGAKIDARSSSGLSPLHAAAYGGHADIVRLLVAKGADINDADNRYGVTPLHMAAEENHVSVAKLLLDHGAKVDVVERNGYTPLSRAGWREHWQIVELLLENGAVCQDAAKVGEWLHEQCSTRAEAS